MRDRLILTVAVVPWTEAALPQPEKVHRRLESTSVINRKKNCTLSAAQCI
jgi:hypothetical protein